MYYLIHYGIFLNKKISNLTKIWVTFSYILVLLIVLGAINIFYILSVHDNYISIITAQ